MNNRSATVEQQAQVRARYFTSLMWHAGAYLIIGTFLVVLDLLGPGWLNWSIWILGFWGFGLAFHILAYLIEGRQIERSLAEKYIAESKSGSEQQSSATQPQE